MKILRGIPRSSAVRGRALTIGNFDGVHRGHRALLAEVVAAARRRGLSAAVMTFEPHPREFFLRERAPARVANLRDKLAALADSGIDEVILQHFNTRFAAVSAERFIDDTLVAGLRARWIAVGDDFRFGATRRGDIAMLRAAAAAGGFEVAQLPTVREGDERVSSSAVRAALDEGDLERARRLLGHPYAISGRVLHGRKLGRTLGFPTLNLRLPRTRPAVHGVFAVRINGLAPHPLPAVASVGLRPTVEDAGRWLLEVHVFDYAGEAYGRLVRVEFVTRLRNEARYGSLAELQAAIQADAAQARAVLGIGA